VTKNNQRAIFLAPSTAAERCSALNEKRLNQIAGAVVFVTGALVGTIQTFANNSPTIRQLFGGQVMRSNPLNLPLIMMEDVTKAFRQGSVETRVLLGVDLTINRGEFVVVFGPSGCGKSTLLAIMGLLDSPTSGVYCVDGQPVQNLKLSDRARVRNQDIGFVFQGFNLIGDMTVFENVEQPLAYSNMRVSDRRARVMELLEMMGIADRARSRPGQLSGGHQQLVAIARALACKPTILLADEPTGNLDSASGQMVMNLLKQLHASGSTVCLVTHDSRFLHLADRKLKMLDGKVIAGDEYIATQGIMR
jgi:putative ABC transport system ATP-binding protein